MLLSGPHTESTEPKEARFRGAAVAGLAAGSVDPQMPAESNRTAWAEGSASQMTIPRTRQPA